MSQDTLDLNPALAARYASAQAALPTPPAGANTAVLQHLLAHRSVRAYLPDALPEGTLAHLVAAAQSAPTSSNLQAWSVLAVTDPERKARLSEWSRDQAHIRQAPLFLVWLADLSRLDRVAQGLGLPRTRWWRPRPWAWAPSTSAPCATGRLKWRPSSSCRPMCSRCSACVWATPTRPSLPP